MSFVSALVAGLLFGAGLLISGMADPANVLAFLDVGGDWNPALALTMGGAIAVLAPVVWLLRRRPGESSGAAVGAARSRPIDRALVVGAVIFGVGWGLSGICPGPGLLLLTTLAPGAIAFIGAMIVGMVAGTKLISRVNAPDG
jgi:uncharacterized membrane protein YedE/YeeE